MADSVEERGGGRNGFPWRAAGWGSAIALLSLPFLAMQFTREVNWTAADFIVAGMLLAVVGGLLELAVRLSREPSYRLGFALAALGMFLVVWTNLAVGIVGSEDNPANGLFFVALLMGVAGSIGAALKPDGMARAMLTAAIAVEVAFVIAESGPRDEPMVRPVVEALGTSIFVMLFLGSAWLFRRAGAAQSSSSS